MVMHLYLSTESERAIRNRCGGFRYNELGIYLSIPNFMGDIYTWNKRGGIIKYILRKRVNSASL